MIIWDRIVEYVAWARKWKVFHLLLLCPVLWLVAITAGFAAGTVLASFLRGFFWLFQLG